MKPQSQITRQLGSTRGELSPLESRSKHPITDYAYHGASGNLGTAKSGSLKISRPKLTPSFRDLSSDFLGAETKRSYAAEAFFFAIIVGVSAWPIALMLQALSLVVK